MDNANRPDRAPPAPPETATVADDDNEDDRNTIDDTDDRQDRAAGPPGIGAPPTSAAPSPTDTVETSDDTDDRDDRGILDRVADTLTAPPTDAEGNARSSSPVADRVANHTASYTVDEFRGLFADDPGLTAEQSRALADGAAVIDEVSVLPVNYAKIPATARNAATEMANAELSIELAVGRRDFMAANDAKLAEIDEEVAEAKAHRAETLERYEEAQRVEFDEYGAPQQASSFEIERRADDFRQANERIETLERERDAVERDRDIPDAIERSLIAEDSYNVTSHLTGSGLERLTDDQLPEGLKSSDMINPETGYVAYAYENRRTGSVELVTRGTDFGVGMDEFARDMMANGGEGFGLPTEQSKQAVQVGREFKGHYEGREMHVTGHSLGGTNASTVSAATGIEGTVFNSGPVHHNTLERHGVTREDMAERVTNYRVEGELVTTGLESPVVEGALGITSPAVAAVATIRNGGDPIPDAVGDPRDLPAANPESSPLEKHSQREVVQSLVQEQQRLIDEHRAGQLSP